MLITIQRRLNFFLGYWTSERLKSRWNDKSKSNHRRKSTKDLFQKPIGTTKKRRKNKDIIEMDNIG